jgi:hypothetical protein
MASEIMVIGNTKDKYPAFPKASRSPIPPIPALYTRRKKRLMPNPVRGEAGCFMSLTIHLFMSKKLAEFIIVCDWF